MASKEAACNVEKGQRGTQSLAPAFLPSKGAMKEPPFSFALPSRWFFWVSEHRSPTMPLFLLSQCSVLPLNFEFWQHSILKDAHYSFYLCPGDGNCRPWSGPFEGNTRYSSHWNDWDVFLVWNNSVLGGFHHTWRGKKSVIPHLSLYMGLGPTVVFFTAW